MNTFWYVLFWENVERYGKTAVFPGGCGRIGVYKVKHNHGTHFCRISQTHYNIVTMPGLIPGSWIMMRHVACILLLEWSTTSQRLWVYRISVPYAQKDPRFLYEKRRGQPREFWSLVSTIDCRTLPQDCVEEQLCS